MKKNRDLYKFRKKEKIISKFYLHDGPTSSTYPSLRSIKWQFAFKFIEGIKEITKFTLLKIFGNKYYEFIYFKKFKKKIMNYYAWSSDLSQSSGKENLL